MASDLSQDAVLHFLRSGGGSVKNADLLLHFRGFIRDHADRDRNREQFKKYVNTLATVQQLDGVSYVVLRRKYRGRAPGGRGEGGSGGARREPSPGNARGSPAKSAEKPRHKPQHMEVTTTAPPGEPASKTILPAAGIIMNNNNNNVEASFNLQLQHEDNKQDLHGGQTLRLPQPPLPDQSSQIGQNMDGFGPPHHGTTPVVTAVRAHGETRQQIPIHEPFKGREAEPRNPHFPGPPDQEWSTRVGQQKVGFGPGMGPEFYAVRSHGETRHQVPIQRPPVSREAHHFSEPPAPHRSPNLGQHMVGYRPPHSGITHRMTRQQRPIQEALRGREAGQMNPVLSEPPAPNRSPNLGHHMMGFGSFPPEIYGETRQQVPIQEPVRGRGAGPIHPIFSEPPVPIRSPKLGQHNVGFAPHHPGITQGEARRKIPVQEHPRAQGPELRDPSFSELPAPNRSPKLGQHETGHGSKAHRTAPEVAAVRSHEEPRLQIPVQEPELKDPSPPSQAQSPKLGQHNAGFGPPPSRERPVNAEAHRETQLETPIQEPLRGQEPELRDPSSSGPTTKDRSPKFGQHKMGLTPLAPEITPVAPAVKPQEEIIPDLETLRRTKAEVLHQEPPPPAQANPNTQVRRRHHRHRKSYKSAVSCDDEEEEEEEEVPVRRGSAGGEWPVSMPLGNMGKAISASSPCIIDVPSVSVSSMDKLPQIYVQAAEEQTMPPQGNPSWSSESGEGLRDQRAEPESSRHSLPLKAEHHVAHTDRRLSQPAVVQLQESGGVELNQRGSLSSSTSNIYSPSSDSGLSMRDWPMSSSPRGSGWSSSLEDLHARTDKMRSDFQMQGALQRAKKSRVESSALHSKLPAPRHHSTGNLHDDHEPFHHSNEHLHGNQLTAPRVMPKNLSTGDLHDDHQQAGLSKDSPPSPILRHPSGVPRRLSSHLRNRMCLSMGADLDQLRQEEERVEGGSEAARLNRLHLISSSLSLRYNLSSSSLSSCSTPPRSQSLANLTEGVEGREGRKSLPTATTASSATPEGSGRQSQVPLESREHDWLVKGAAGAWPDIYSLFREDSTLLNRRDFISGFTVLHWIAKHGDHRVLNTLWYGVQKAGLTFDINARSSSGHTPLHIAAIHGHKNIMRLLVSKFNADVKLRDTAGKRAWQYLSRTSAPEVFQLLGAPPRAALGGGGGAIVRAESPWRQEKPHPRRRRRHHLSSASSAERPQGFSAKVKRSSSIAAFLKHKSLQYFHPSDSAI